MLDVNPLMLSGALKGFRVLFRGFLELFKGVPKVFRDVSNRLLGFKGCFNEFL